MYMRVRDKETRHQFDVLEESFDETKLEEVKAGPLKGKRARPKPPKLNQSYLGGKSATKTTSPESSEEGDDEDEEQTPGEPSGGNEEKKEDH